MNMHSHVAEPDAEAPNAWPRLRLITADELWTMAEAGAIGPDEKVELVEGELLVKTSPKNRTREVVHNTLRYDLGRKARLEEMS